MPRYIDAECFSERFDMMCDAGGVLAPVTEAVREMVKKLIEAEPAVDVQSPELEIHREQWISTKEKMPENDKSVLICACGHRVTAYYNHLKNAFILTENEKLYYETTAVSHWMPLPEVPQEDAVDVEPVRHGRWEDYYVGDRQEEGVICTVCKKLCKCEFDYCPNCGAKMYGGKG